MFTTIPSASLHSGPLGWSHYNQRLCTTVTINSHYLGLRGRLDSARQLYSLLKQTPNLGFRTKQHGSVERTHTAEAAVVAQGLASNLQQYLYWFISVDESINLLETVDKKTVFEAFCILVGPVRIERQVCRSSRRLPSNIACVHLLHSLSDDLINTLAFLTWPLPGEVDNWWQLVFFHRSLFYHPSLPSNMIPVKTSLLFLNELLI